MKYLLPVAILILILVGCKNVEDNADTNSNSPTQIVSLNAGDCSPVDAGNTLTKLEDDTEVAITHDIDGSKTVCVNSGKARLNRSTQLQ